MPDGAFIFDMDGTLIDNARFHAQAWREFLAELGVGLDGVDLQKLTGGQTNEQVLHRVLGARLLPDRVVEYAERKEELYRSLVAAHLQPLPGLLRFLEEATSLGIRLAVVTASGPANIEFTLNGLGAKEYFQVVVGAQHVQNGKPHPEGFLTAARRLGLAPERCVVFEDSTAGVEAAWRAGMAAVAISTTLSPSVLQCLPSVMHVVEDYSELEPASLLAELPAAHTGPEQGSAKAGTEPRVP